MSHATYKTANIKRKEPEKTYDPDDYIEVFERKEFKRFGLQVEAVFTQGARLSVPDIRREFEKRRWEWRAEWIYTFLPLSDKIAESGARHYVLKNKNPVSLPKRRWCNDLPALRANDLTVPHQNSVYNERKK